MAKTYKKISSTWYPIKKIFKRISGTWSEVKKLYKKASGTWQVVHSSAYEYTFTANAANVDFATLIGASNVANNTEFKITINSGVTIYGTNGVVGANNGSMSNIHGAFGARYCYATWCAGYMTVYYDVIRDALCEASYTYASYYFTGNGGTGSNGNNAISFAGMSGKTITITNNGAIIGGNGGAGGMGASLATANYPTGIAGGYGMACALGGAGGVGASAIVNGSNTVSVLNNQPIQGNNGATGPNGHSVVNANYSDYSAG